MWWSHISGHKSGGFITPIVNFSQLLFAKGFTLELYFETG